MLDMLTPATTPRELRPHQVEALAALRQSIGQGVRRIMLQSPTGAGKTRISAEIVAGALRKGNKLAFVVPAISLVDQTVEMFEGEGIHDIGVIQANHRMTDWSRHVQICSIQTLQRRDFPQAQIVIIDEAHKLFRRHIEWLGHPDWQAVPFIGLSATPWARGLGKHFETLLVAATTEELIAAGWLSPFRTFAPSEPDMSKVRTMAGDYHEGDLSEAVNLPPLVADIVSTWQQRWGRDKTLCFCVDRAHAQAVRDQFLDAGIVAGYQDAFTPDQERRDLKRRFHAGEVRVVCSVGTMIVGVDWDVRCLIWARPTKSEMLFVQGTGRALRTAEGKDEALILDHAGNSLRLGLVTDIHHDHLDDGSERAKKQREEEAKRKAPLPKKCPACTALKPASVHRCPSCGFAPERQSTVETVDGELFELTPGMPRKKGSKREYTSAEKAAWFGMLKCYARQKGYKPGYAANKFKAKFEVWPNAYREAPEQEPNYEVHAWLRSQQIRWHKGKEKAAARAAGGDDARPHAA